MELVDYQYLEQVPFSKWTFALSDSLVRQIQQKLRKQREHVITLQPPSFYKIKHNINNDAKKKPNLLPDVIIRIPLFLRSSRDSIWCWLPPSPHSGNLPILSSSQNGRICSPGGVFSPYPHRYSPPTEQPTPLRDTTADTKRCFSSYTFSVLSSWI